METTGQSDFIILSAYIRAIFLLQIQETSCLKQLDPLNYHSTGNNNENKAGGYNPLYTGDPSGGAYIDLTLGKSEIKVLPVNKGKLYCKEEIPVRKRKAKINC